MHQNNAHCPCTRQNTPCPSGLGCDALQGPHAVPPLEERRLRALRERLVRASLLLVSKLPILASHVCGQT